MCIVPFPSIWIDCTLRKKQMPCTVPALELFSKGLLIHLSYFINQLAKLDARLKSWSACQISGDNRLLMKVAHLYRDIPEKWLQAWLSVCNDCRYIKAKRLKCDTGISILIKRLSLYL